MNQSIFQMQARLIRRDLRRAAQKWRYRRLNLYSLPVFFANSFPKSGTHLLTQVLQGFTLLGPAVNSGLPAIVSYQGDSGRALTVKEVLTGLQRLRPGDITYGHLHALPEVVSYLSQEGFATYFLIRDPRDVVVSHVHYVTDMASRHAHHKFYLQELQNFDQRLRTSILGRPDSEAPFPDIGARFRPYLGWLGRRDVLVLRYEELVHDREGALARIVGFAVSRGFSLNCERERAVDKLRSGIQPQKSPTFRRGETGGWRDHFNAEHKEIFKEVAGDLLIRLGYERDVDW